MSVQALIFVANDEPDVVELLARVDMLRRRKKVGVKN